MDERLKDALDFSNFRLILATKHENLKTLMNNNLKLTHNGGVFKATTQFISFIDTMLKSGERELIVLDLNDTPIKINETITEFKQKLVDTYKKATESYSEEYEKLSEAKGIREVLDWDEEN